MTSTRSRPRSSWSRLTAARSRSWRWRRPSAAKIEPNPDAGTVRVRRISATGYDLLEASMPALIVGTQLLGTPRYPSLKGIMGARSKEVVQRSVADVGLSSEGDGAVGGSAA